MGGQDPPVPSHGNFQACSEGHSQPLTQLEYARRFHRSSVTSVTDQREAKTERILKIFVDCFDSRTVERQRRTKELVSQNKRSTVTGEMGILAFPDFCPLTAGKIPAVYVPSGVVAACCLPASGPDVKSMVSDSLDWNPEP
jgi:hypothetical protein